MGGPWVVTGAGIVSVAGETPDAVHSALTERNPYATLRTEQGIVAAGIDGFDPRRSIPRKGVRDLSRTSQLACAAAAGNSRGILDVPVEEVGVAFGTAWGSVGTVIDFEREAHLQGPRFVDPILFTETVANVPAGQVAIFFGWSAFNATVSAGSASGLAGLQRALEFLHEGRGSVAVAGGGDALSPPILRALASQGTIASNPRSLPLDRDRSGRVGGEGACFLTLESESHARRRGAAALARIRSTAGRFFPREARADRSEHGSLAGLIRELLLRADLAPGEIDVIVLSSSGDAAGDLIDGLAVLEVFGGRPVAPPVVAPKAILGETWGASGALAAVVALEIIRTSKIPGAPSGFVPDPEIESLHVPAETVVQRVRNALILDRADQGHQLGLVLSAENGNGGRS